MSALPEGWANHTPQPVRWVLGELNSLRLQTSDARMWAAVVSILALFAWIAAWILSS